MRRSRSRGGFNLCSIAVKEDILFFILGKWLEVGMPKTERDREISRRRQKRLKMEFLKKRLADAKDSKARAAIAQKILKLNPQANVSPK
jgi:hypothetical protein